MTILIEVTQEDISRGIPCDGSRCAIGRAIERLFPEATEIDVDGQTAYVATFDQYRDEALQFTLPPEARDFVRQYDAKQPVSPITFTASDCN